jgi:hypothetical protein
MPAGIVRLCPVVILLTVFLSGCDCCGCKEAKTRDKQKKQKHEEVFDPANQYPEWAYDAPFYYRPARDRGDVGEEIASRQAGGPTHYYVRDRLVYMPRPVRKATTSPATPTLGARTTERDMAPRIGVFWTDSGGLEWERAGYFGIGQTHFVFPAENDGVYGFRFIGPDQPPAKCTPPRPQIVYHVDTVPPEVVVYVEPNQPAYHVSESVTIHWMAQDVHLSDSPVSISACWLVGDDDACEWTPIIHDQPSEGSMTFAIPPHATDCRLRIRADARDRSGNLGVGFSPPMVVAQGTSTGPVTVTTKPSDATTQPATTAMDTMGLLDEGELASFSTTDRPSGPLAVPAPAPYAPLAEPEPVGPALPKPAPRPATPDGPAKNASERPRQQVSQTPPADARTVWKLPARRLPVTTSQASDEIR